MTMINYWLVYVWPCDTMFGRESSHDSADLPQVGADRPAALYVRSGAGATSTAASIDMRNGLVLNCRPARSFRELDDAFDRRYLHRLARWSGIRRWNGRTTD